VQFFSSWYIFLKSFPLLAIAGRMYWRMQHRHVLSCQKKVVLFAPSKLAFMNRISVYSSFLALLFVSSSFQCNKNDNEFCNKKRTSVLNLNERGGTIVYNNRYKMYGVRIDSAIANNIDTEIVGLPCELPKELRNAGARVTITGELKKFNADENMTPDLGGEELYFLELASVQPKP
jgi:hypothetical protein